MADGVHWRHNYSNTPCNFARYPSLSSVQHFIYNVMFFIKQMESRLYYEPKKIVATKKVVILYLNSLRPLPLRIFPLRPQPLQIHLLNLPTFVRPLEIPTICPSECVILLRVVDLWSCAKPQIAGASCLVRGIDLKLKVGERVLQSLESCLSIRCNLLDLFSPDNRTPSFVFHDTIFEETCCEAIPFVLVR